MGGPKLAGASGADGIGLFGTKYLSPFKTSWMSTILPLTPCAGLGAIDSISQVVREPLFSVRPPAHASICGEASPTGINWGTVKAATSGALDSDTLCAVPVPTDDQLPLAFWAMIFQALPMDPVDDEEFVIGVAWARCTSGAAGTRSQASLMPYVSRTPVGGIANMIAGLPSGGDIGRNAAKLLLAFGSVLSDTNTWPFSAEISARAAQRIVHVGVMGIVRGLVPVELQAPSNVEVHTMTAASVCDRTWLESAFIVP